MEPPRKKVPTDILKKDGKRGYDLRRSVLPLVSDWRVAWGGLEVYFGQWSDSVVLYCVGQDMSAFVGAD